MGVQCDAPVGHIHVPILSLGVSVRLFWFCVPSHERDETKIATCVCAFLTVTAPWQRETRALACVSFQFQRYTGCDEKMKFDNCRRANNQTGVCLVRGSNTEQRKPHLVFCPFKLPVWHRNKVALDVGGTPRPARNTMGSLFRSLACCWHHLGWSFWLCRPLERGIIVRTCGQIHRFGLVSGGPSFGRWLCLGWVVAASSKSAWGPVPIVQHHEDSAPRGDARGDVFWCVCPRGAGGRLRHIDGTEW